MVQGSGQMGELLGRRRRRRRRHQGSQVDIQARELYLEFLIRFWVRGERYLRMETGVLHRISIQIDSLEIDLVRNVSRRYRPILISLKLDSLEIDLDQNRWC